MLNISPKLFDNESPAHHSLRPTWSGGIIPILSPENTLISYPKRILCNSFINYTIKINSFYFVVQLYFHIAQYYLLKIYRFTNTRLFIRGISMYIKRNFQSGKFNKLSADTINLIPLKDSSKRSLQIIFPPLGPLATIDGN